MTGNRRFLRRLTRRRRSCGMQRGVNDHMLGPIDRLASFVPPAQRFHARPGDRLTARPTCRDRRRHRLSSFLAALSLLVGCSRAAPVPSVAAADASPSRRVLGVQPLGRPLDEPAVPAGVCRRVTCVGPSDIPPLQPFRIPYSRCAPTLTIDEQDRHPGDLREGAFSASATRTGRLLDPDACCYLVLRVCDAGVAVPGAARRRARRPSNR